MALLGDVVGSALPGLRAEAESMMRDSCAIVRLGTPVTDPDTGVVTIPETEMYSGKAKVQTYEAQESHPEAGESVRTVQRYALHIPVGSYAPAVGDVATITTAFADPALVGRRYRVTALLHKTLATAYRLGVTEEV